MRQAPATALLVALAACGSAATHALHARLVPPSVPPISVQVTTTTTAPPETVPPITVAIPPPTTAAPQPAVNCLTILNEANAGTEQNLGRNATKAELAEIATGIGRSDCLAAVDSYRPPYNPGPFPSNPLGPTVSTTPNAGPGCDIAHTVC